MARLNALVVASLVLLSAAIPLAIAGAAVAGSPESPEMEDASGDSTSGRDTRDLLAGWITNETENSIEFNLHMAALDPFTPFSDWESLPIVYYEFLFDVTTPGGKASYAARATIPVHGPTAAFAQYETLLVNYTAQGTVADETVLSSETGRYLFNAGLISITVDKANLGEPARGDLLDGAWARITSTSQRGSADVITEDTMMSHVAPGKSFSFTGGVTYFAVSLSATSTSANATADNPAIFEVRIHSDSEKQANVSLRNSSTLPTNWTLRTDKAIYIVGPGENFTAFVTITPGANRSNETRRVTVVGDYKDDQNGNRTTENAITFTVVVPPAGGGGGGGDGGGGGGGGSSIPFPGGTTGLAVAGLGLVAIVALAVFGVYVPRRRAAAAKQRLQRMSQKAWSRSPRTGPGQPGSKAPGAVRPAQPGAGPPGPGSR